MSLFAGVCTDYWALTTWLSRQGALSLLKHAWYVEQNPALASAVRDAWERQRRTDPGPGLEPLCQDVRDLVDCDVVGCL